VCVCEREVSDEMKARKTNSCNTSERKGARGEERGGERGGERKKRRGCNSLVKILSMLTRPFHSNFRGLAPSS
jgi:hypothetical protein